MKVSFNLLEAELESKEHYAEAPVHAYNLQCCPPWSTGLPKQPSERTGGSELVHTCQMRLSRSLLRSWQSGPNLKAHICSPLMVCVCVCRQVRQLRTIHSTRYYSNYAPGVWLTTKTPWTKVFCNESITTWEMFEPDDNPTPRSSKNLDTGSRNAGDMKVQMATQSTSPFPAAPPVVSWCMNRMLKLLPWWSQRERVRERER